jgi:hypothetical protein
MNEQGLGFLNSGTVGNPKTLSFYSGSNRISQLWRGGYHQ